MPNTTTVRISPLSVLLVALAVAAGTIAAPAWAQDTTSSTTSPPGPSVTLPGTTTTLVGEPDDPGEEEVSDEPVPVVPDTVPPRAASPTGPNGQAARIVRKQLQGAKAESLVTSAAYADAKHKVVDLEIRLDLLETSVMELSATDRAALRRVEIARRQFEVRAANAVVRGGLNDFSRYVATSDPNELAMAGALLDSVLAADQRAVAEYLAAKADVDEVLVGMAERLVDSRLALVVARAAMVEARRTDVAAQLALAVFQAGSEIMIHGFTFPVGEPHSFGDSFGAPRMAETQYQHAHQGTDIMAPFGTPLFAAERGIITKMGTDVLGGTKIWVKGESGTYYYYAHLRSFGDGMVDGLVVEAGTVIGYVGDTGNARGGAPHLHFEIHPDGGPAVNPYPLLKVVDQLARSSSPRPA